MPRRKQLKSIAGGLSGKFVSRYNDVDGYWALGLLYKKASSKLIGRKKTCEFVLDILSGNCTPEFKYSGRIATPLHTFLKDQLRKQNFGEHQLVSAFVHIKFNVKPTDRQIRLKDTWGEPFVCVVTLEDDLGKSHVSNRRGWCGVHDKNMETRSTRAYAS